MKEFAFDVRLNAVVRVTAKTRKDAESVARQLLDGASPSDSFVDGFNDGMKADKRSVEVTEFSSDDSAFELFEIDGKPSKKCMSGKPKDWSGSPDPRDPDNFWIDDKTGERVNAKTGERTKFVPLKIDEADDLPLAIIEDTEDGLGVCEEMGKRTPENLARAARIVLAYNAYDDLVKALKAITERAEAVAESIPVENRARGVSQAAHVRHMAGHLAQHAKIAREALKKAAVKGAPKP